jgi:molecular chaperone DnaK (HSP70)
LCESNHLKLQFYIQTGEETSIMDETRRVFGIDLGTTYSCVAQVDEHDKAVVLTNFDSELTTPSVVYFGNNDEIYVGKTAKEYSKLEPEKTVAFIKREMSKKEAFQKPTKFPGGLTPTEISARILKKIVEDANAAGQYPEPIKKVVITCPAYFGTAERERTKQAGIIAGLEVLAILNEPTAAAIAYGQGKREGEKIILVYDLGGGTFDVDLVKVNNCTFTGIATDGNHGLGGYDWDKKLAQYLLSEYNKQKSTSYEMKEGTALFNEMMIFAEEQKRRLSAKKDEDSALSAILTIKGDTAKIDITRAVFDAMTSSLLNETIEKTHGVLRVGKEKGFNRLDEVLLVGGSCFMPQVKARLDSELGCNAKLYDPNQCVAKGAAIMALNASYHGIMEDYITGKDVVKPEPLADGTQIHTTIVTSKNYGIELEGDVVQNLIPKDSPLKGNCRGERTFSVPRTGCTSLVFPVYESDNTSEEPYDKKMATLLEEKSLEIPSSSKEGDPVKVLFEVDTQGFLHVRGEVLGKLIKFDVKLPGVMNEKELQEATDRLSREKSQ